MCVCVCVCVCVCTNNNNRDNKDMYSANPHQCAEKADIDIDIDKRWPPVFSIPVCQKYSSSVSITTFSSRLRIG